MSKKKIYVMSFTIVMLVILIALCFFYTNNAVSRMPYITQANYNINSHETYLTIADIANLSKYISDNSVGFTSESKEIYVKNTKITPVLTTSNYFTLYSESLLGTGILEEHISEKEKVVIISESLALDIYFNIDCLGRTFMMDGYEYKVVGVYMSKGFSLINEISNDQRERVYIPYTCAEDYDIAPVHTLAYHNNSKAAPIVEQMKLSQYCFTNFSEKSKVLDSFGNIVLFVLFIGVCVLTLRIWWLLCKKLLAHIRNDLSENYLIESIRAIPIKYILLALIGVGIPAILCFWLCRLDFSLYISSQYIPDDNLFDISYYIERVIENSQYMNSALLVGNTWLMNLYKNTFNIVIWIMIGVAMVWSAVVALLLDIIDAILAKI